MTSHQERILLQMTCRIRISSLNLCESELSAHFAQSIGAAQQKRENTWAKMLALFPRSDWYVSTDDDVWWNVTGLQTLLAPLNTSKPRLVGMGAGHSVNGPFVVMNRPLLELFADAALLSACRAELLRLNPWARYTYPGARYNDDHLISFCVRRAVFFFSFRFENGLLRPA
jgi:hypothetical protein